MPQQKSAQASQNKTTAKEKTIMVSLDDFPIEISIVPKNMMVKPQVFIVDIKKRNLRRD